MLHETYIRANDNINASIFHYTKSRIELGTYIISSEVNRNRCVIEQEEEEGSQFSEGFWMVELGTWDLGRGI